MDRRRAGELGRGMRGKRSLQFFYPGDSVFRVDIGDNESTEKKRQTPAKTTQLIWMNKDNLILFLICCGSKIEKEYHN